MAVGDRGFHIADAFVEIHADKEPLRQEIRDLPSSVGGDAETSGRGVGKRVGKGIRDGADGKGVGKGIGDDVDRTLGPRSDTSGRDSGNKLSKGMQLAIVRNSPLIAAGIGAALAFGAPTALAGATVLFAGIAVAAGAQSQAVQAAWSGTWDNISATLKGQSGPMQAELTHLAGFTNARFMDMQQSITDAMSASVPQVDRLVSSLLNMVDNALPGLVHAVQNAGPAVDGLGNLLESIGTGLGGFFDQISQHSPAAGAAFTALGQILQTILPLLGSLLGQGAELAAIVLPPLARILDVVAGALEHIAPILPMVAAGFTAWKIITVVSSYLETLSARLQTAAADGGRFGTAIAGNAAAGVSRLQSVIPGLIGALVTVGALWGSSQRQIDDWSQALIDGGQKAATATRSLEDAHTRSLLDAHSLSDAWGIVKGAFADGAAQLQGYDSAQDKATQGARKMLAAMDPVTRAQTLEKQALADLNFALEKHGEGSASAETAERKYADATDATKKAQADEEKAIHGVTQAMMDQADEALAAIDSGIALRRATSEATQAEKDYQKELATGKVHLNDNSTATLDYETALSRMVAASGQAAADASGLTDKLDLQKVSTAAQLQTLYQLRDELGVNFPASLQAAITKLEGMGVTTDTTSGKLDDLGNKNPTPTIGPAKDNVSPQVDNMMNSLFDLGAAHPVPQVDLDTDPAIHNKDVMLEMLDNLGIQHPTPSADLDIWGRFNPNMLNALAQVGNLQAQHPTPTSYLNTGPLQTSTSFALGQLYSIGATNPVSTSSLVDRASGPLSSIRAYLNSLDGRVVTTYVNTIGRNVLATGGEILDRLAPGFDGGGVFGPGTGTSDEVPAVGPNGASYRLSNGEHVFTKREVDEMGGQGAVYRFRKLLDSGRFDASMISGTGGTPAAVGINPSTGSGQTNTGTTIGELHLHIDGSFDFTKPDAVRTLAQKIRAAIIELERERK